MLIKDVKVLFEEKDLVETFNKYYINMAENSSGIKPYNVALEKDISKDKAAIDLIIKFYKNHPSIGKIK